MAKPPQLTGNSPQRTRTARQPTGARRTVTEAWRTVAATATRDRRALGMSQLIGYVPLLAAVLATALGAPRVVLPIGIAAAVVLAFVVLLVRGSRSDGYADRDAGPGAVGATVAAMPGWRVLLVTAATAHHDMVHVAIGPPGIVLLGEGDPTRLSRLMATQRERVAAQVTEPSELACGMHELVVQHGQSPVDRTAAALRRLPAELTPEQVDRLAELLAANTAELEDLPVEPVIHNHDHQQHSDSNALH